MTMNNSQFRTNVGAYECQDCHKKTRETGHGESALGLCRSCMVQGELSNAHLDGEHKMFVEGCPDCLEELALAMEKADQEQSEGSVK